MTSAPTRRTEDDDLNDEQQHPGLHTPLAEPVDGAEDRQVNNGRKNSDSQQVMSPQRREDTRGPAAD